MVIHSIRTLIQQTARRLPHRSLMRRCAASGWLLALALFVGCETTSGEKYTFNNMPPELLAAKRENAQTLDLTKLARAAGNSDIIDRGDVIEVSIAAGLDEKEMVKFPVRVNEAGVGTLPEIGQVRLAGLETEAAEAAIVLACIERQLYRSPNVTVTMKRQRTNLVTVTGAVQKPGTYELPRGRSDLLAAIVAAGNLDKDAGTMIEIRKPNSQSTPRSDRIAAGNPSGINTVGMNGEPSLDLTGVATAGGGGFQSVRIDLVSAIKSGNESYVIPDGTVINVEKRDPEPLHVMGLVKRPDRYEFPIAEDVRVTDAIALAGGMSVPVADKIFVIRRKGTGGQTAVIQVSLRQAKRNSAANLRLAPGDVVSVEQTPSTIVMEALNVIRFGIGASLPLPGF
jgi:polysaccharide biosynthesis/export protein